MAANKHQQKTEATRRKLLEAALQVFSRDGFEAARIEDIAAESGYTRGAFYANFDTKEDLFFALLEEQAGALPCFSRRRCKSRSRAPACSSSRAKNRSSLVSKLA
jgi:AcrR family transcriptional regulator